MRGQMYPETKVVNMKKLKYFFYSLSVGLPMMFLGYLKDKVLLFKESTDPVINDVKNDGIHIFKNLLTEDEIQELLNDFENLKKVFPIGRDGQSKGRIYKQGVLTPLLDMHAERIKPLVINFLNTERIKIEISYYQESFPSIDIEEVPGGEFHVDDNKANLKYFIYLSDVNEDNGPFSCVPRTGNWRLKGSFIRGIYWELTKKRSFLYDYLIDVAECIKNEKKIIGKKGTQFLVDTTALHRAQPVVHGERKVAVISFNRMGVF